MKDYKTVEYKNNSYCVCRYQKQNGKNKLFIIDEEDLEKVTDSGHTWYEVNGYVGYTEMINRENFTHYLHNLVKDKASGGGKGQKLTIDHINRIPHDNRKVNLRLVSQTIQNKNQGDKRRGSNLPEDCDIEEEEIPKCVSYRRADKTHGERWVFEIKENGKRILSKSSTNDNDFSLRDKLIHIKKRILDLAEEFPKYFEDRGILENYSDEQLQLMKQFNKIIKLSGYKCAEDNLIEIPEKKVLECDIENASKEMRKLLKGANTTKASGKSIKSNNKYKGKFVNDKPFSADMVPKYAYFQSATEKRGEFFGIRRHPKLSSWQTSQRKDVSFENKYFELMEKMKKIEEMDSDVDEKPDFKKSDSKNRKSKVTKSSGSKTARKPYPISLNKRKRRID